MFKFSTTIAVLFALFAVKDAGATIPIGGSCASILGPTGTCVSGSTCCYLSPDHALCAAGTTCPDRFLDPGASCSGIAGPSPYPCYPGTTCCNLGPDHSVCKAKC